MFDKFEQGGLKVERVGSPHSRLLFIPLTSLKIIHCRFGWETPRMAEQINIDRSGGIEMASSPLAYSTCCRRLGWLPASISHGSSTSFQKCSPFCFAVGKTFRGSVLLGYSFTFTSEQTALQAKNGLFFARQKNYTCCNARG